MRYILAVCAVLLLVVGKIGYDLIKSINLPPDCQSREVKFVIAKKSLDEIHSCHISDILVDGKPAKYVTVSYGPGMDCFAGCFYQGYVGFILNGKLKDFISQPALDNLLTKKYGQWCILDISTRRGDPNLIVGITQENNAYHWSYQFRNFSNEIDIRSAINEEIDWRSKIGRGGILSIADNPQYCTFNGNFVVREVASGYAQRVDFSNLTVKRGPLRYIPKSADELIGDCMKIERLLTQERCISEVADAKEDPNLCFRITKAVLTIESTQGSCIRTIAVRKLDTGICSMIAHHDQQLLCYRDVRDEKARTSKILDE